MIIEDLARRIIEGNAVGRSRSLGAHSMLSEALTTGGEIDADAIFAELTDDDSTGHDEASAGPSPSVVVGGVPGGQAPGT